VATLTVYPGMKPDGTRCSVLASDLVTPIPDAGAVVGYSEYYIEKLAQQLLLTEDPVNSGGTPIELLIPPLLVTGTPSAGQTIEATGPNTAGWATPAAASAWLATMAVLAAVPGTVARQLKMIVGCRVAGDGGGGLFYWDALSTEADNGGTIIGAFALGRWKRVYDPSVVHVDWFGAPNDNIIDALPALNTALTLTPVGGTLRLGPFHYRIEGKWDLQSGKNITGCAGDGGGLFEGTIISYYGPTDTTELGCAINARQFATLKDIRVQIGFGRKCKAGICAGSAPWTLITFDNVGVVCWADSNSYFEYAYTVGSSAIPGGCDTFRWIRGFVADPPVGAVLVQGGQPYALLFKEVNFINQVAGYMGSINGAVAHGTVLKTANTYFGSVAFENNNIGYFAELIESPLSGMSNVSVMGGQWEGMKRIWTGIGKDGNAACVVSIDGGRYNTTQLDKPVYRLDGSVHIAAADRRLIFSEQGSPISIRNAHIGSGTSSAADNTATIDITEMASFTADGCIFPNPGIVTRTNTFDLQSGGTYIRGCKAYQPPGPQGVIIAMIPERHGPENADFVWTADGDVMGATTVATVTLPQLEMGAGGVVLTGGRTDYLIYMHPHGYTGTPPDGAFRTRIVPGEIKNVSFDVELDAVPGAGNTVTFSVSLKLRSDVP
jgi:hypothetical protein